MCFNWRNQQHSSARDELTLDEIEKISKGFSNLFQFTVAGGEPFIRDDVAEIVRCFYTNSGARSVTLPTNAYFSEKIEKTVRKILQQCPECLLNVCLSLDALGDEHDRIRQLPGGFKALLNTYQRLKDIRETNRNLYIKVTTVLSKFNADQVPEIFDYVRENLEVDDHELLLARGDTREAEARAVPMEKYRQLLEQVEQNGARNLEKRQYQFSRVFYGLYKYMNRLVDEVSATKKLVFPCLAGRRLVEIYDDGLVVPCEILPVSADGRDLSFGNIRDHEYDINAILKTAQAKKVNEYIAGRNCCCTFECALLTNIVFNPRAYPGLIRHMYCAHNKPPAQEENRPKNRDHSQAP
ncbi:MAG: radical SAM protein [Proteobacteria bacterium]|nr:radical SAM protein [Pseudomonadota bacterium]MBU1738383.1 radical SAM protein [Pseudomonadota bacterium]